jgi:ketosteroid isomerase-like protein
VLREVLDEYAAAHRQRAARARRVRAGAGGGYRLHTLQVLTVSSGRVAGNVVFADPHVFEAFGLPGQISGGGFRQTR